MARRNPVKPPKIDNLHLSHLEDGSHSQLRAGADLESQRFEGLDSSGLDLTGISFDGCEIVSWDTNETELLAARFIESSIKSLHAPVFSAPRSLWKDVRISISRIGSGELYESELTEVVISDCKFGWLNLRGAQLRDVIFRSCSFEELDLAGASLTRVAFEDCTTEQIDIDRAVSHDVDLRGIEFHALSGTNSLKGTVLSSAQIVTYAEIFANHLGVRVEG